MVLLVWPKKEEDGLLVIHILSLYELHLLANDLQKKKKKSFFLLVYGTHDRLGEIKECP